MNIEGEERLGNFDLPVIPTRRPWSAWLAQFAEIVRRRPALPFPVDAEFRDALRDLTVEVAALESLGVSGRRAGMFSLSADLVGALVKLRSWIRGAFDAAREKGDGDVLALATRAQGDLKTVLARVKIAWPYDEEEPNGRDDASA